MKTLKNNTKGKFGDVIKEGIVFLAFF